jgi:hypothetical protein
MKSKKETYMLKTSLKALMETWEKNPRITLTELVIMYEADAQNVKRWMKSAGFVKVPDDDKKVRFVRRNEIKVITETPPEGLTEAQRTQFYIGLGYDSYSICVHQNILLATAEDRREELKKRTPQKASSSHLLSEDQLELPCPAKHREAGPILTIPKVEEDAQSQENRVYEYGQDDKYPEYGDKQSHHISEITRATLFPKGIPTCLPCQRSVLYTDIIHCNNNNWQPLYPNSYLHTNAEPKIIFPQTASYHQMNQWAQYVKFPLTGNQDIDDMRILEAFVADATANFLRNRMPYIARELIKGNYSSIEDYRKPPYVPRH